VNPESGPHPQDNDLPKTGQFKGMVCLRRSPFWPGSTGRAGGDRDDLELFSKTCWQG